MKFDAMITCSGKSPTFSCTTFDTDVEVEEVVIRKADGGTTSDDEMFYAGPTLEELEEDLQQSLNDFVVNEYGLNEDFVAFVSMYADYKEQIDHIDWLKGIDSFLQ